MNILITGGAGYLGSLLVPHILNNIKCNITILDNLSYGIAPILYIISNNKRDLNRYKWSAERLDKLLKNKNSKHYLIYEEISNLLNIIKTKVIYKMKPIIPDSLNHCK